MPRYKRRIDEVEAVPITPALIASRPDLFREAVINPFTGLPVAPEDEDQATNAGWPRRTFLTRPGLVLSEPLTFVNIGDFLITDADGGIAALPPTQFAKVFVLA